MNRNQLLAFLVAAAGSVAGGIALVQGVLAPGAQLLVECAPEGDCVMAARPKADQCPVLLEGGGDRPGEVTGIDGRPEHEAVRILFALQEAQAIGGFRTVVDVDGGCVVAIQLSREQARAWREVLTGQNVDGGIIGDGAALATLTPTSPAGLPIQWGGGPAPEDRTEAFDLLAVDGGTP